MRMFRTLRTLTLRTNLMKKSQNPINGSEGAFGAAAAAEAGVNQILPRSPMIF